jgi:hypothetical protein
VPLGLASLFHIATQRINETFNQQETHLKKLLLSWGLKMTRSKPGCKVSALHFFVFKKKTPPITL